MAKNRQKSLKTQFLANGWTVFQHFGVQQHLLDAAYMMDTRNIGADKKTSRAIIINKAKNGQNPN